MIDEKSMIMKMIDDEVNGMLCHDAFNFPAPGIKIPKNIPNLAIYTSEELKYAAQLISQEKDKLSSTENILPSRDTYEKLISKIIFL